jgi:hypothetical protein
VVGWPPAVRPELNGGEVVVRVEFDAPDPRAGPGVTSATMTAAVVPEDAPYLSDLLVGEFRAGRIVWLHGQGDGHGDAGKNR